MAKNGDEKNGQFKPGNSYPGWAADFDKPVCEKCGIGRHHCETAGCECPVCH